MRMILIDNNSGYVWGDTADLPPIATSTSQGLPMTQSDLTSPIDAARWLDESLNEHGRNYELLGHNPRDTSTGYHVYRADGQGSDLIAVIQDGQNQDEIDAVHALPYLGYVRVTTEIVD